MKFVRVTTSNSSDDLNYINLERISAVKVEPTKGRATLFHEGIATTIDGVDEGFVVWLEKVLEISGTKGCVK